MSLAFIESQFEEAKKTLDNFISNPKNAEHIDQSAQLMVKSIQNGGKVISCGNGGSMSDAMHFAEELTGRYRENRKSLPSIAISDPGYLTCAGNDFGYDFIFSRFIEGMGQEGDTLLAISTSGNSANVVNAAKVARGKGIKVVALTGKNGGELAKYCDVEVRVPHEGYADRIQEIHIKVIHCFIGLIEKELIQ